MYTMSTYRVPETAAGKNKDIVTKISKVYSNCSFKFRDEPFKSDIKCINFLAKMKQVYDSVCIYRVPKGGQFDLDFTLSNVTQTRPLLLEAFDLYYAIPERWRVGFGVAQWMSILNLYSTKYLATE